MANDFRARVESALRTLDDPAPLRAPRAWYRNGTRGSLHANRHCYKLDSWGSTQATHTLEEAAKKRTCASCCKLEAVVDRDVARTIEQLAVIENHLTAATNAANMPGTAHLGSALADIETATNALSVLKEDEHDRAAKTVERMRARLAELRDAVTGKTGDVKDTAISWATMSLSRRIVLRDESAVPGRDGNDLVIFGENHSTEHQKLDNLLGRVYLRWCRAREKGEDAAREAALGLLDEARLTRPMQLDFVTDSETRGTNLLETSFSAWKQELVNRLTGRLIPAWETVYGGFAAKTQPVVIGLGGEIYRDDTRSLLAAHPGTRSGEKRVAIVPEVVGEYIQVLEKRWHSDIVETAAGCDPELLDTVAALWEPNSRESEFQTLEAAVRAASAV